MAKTGELPDGSREYFMESINCLHHQLFRAAVVAVWSGFIHVFTETLKKSGRIPDDGEGNQGPTISSLEKMTDFALLEKAEKVGFIKKREMRELQGYLAVRNRCAHFSETTPPGLNQALGVAEALLTRVITYSRSD